jgi:iron-sulfur cluster assembly protein
MIVLTSAAATQIRVALQASGAEDLALRIAARRLPDGELDYGMGFDEPREEDLALDLDGIAVVIGAPSQGLLEGTVLDYVEYTPGEFRFIFIPPSEQGPAPRGGCGGGGCSGCGG